MTLRKSLLAKKAVLNPSSSCPGKNEADKYFNLVDLSILKYFIQKVSI